MAMNDDYELRLQCLNIIASRVSFDDIVSEAQRIYDFVTNVQTNQNNDTLVEDTYDNYEQGIFDEGFELGHADGYEEGFADATDATSHVFPSNCVTRKLN